MQPTVSSITPLQEITTYHVSHLQQLLGYAAKKKYAIAMWRMPVATEGGIRHVVMDYSGKTNVVEANFEKLPAGFVVSPFEQIDEKVYFIQADYHYQSDKPQLPADISVFSTPFSTPLSTPFSPPYNKSAADTNVSLSKEAFEKMVAEAVSAMQQGQFQKVVLSRTKLLDLPKDFDIALAFEKLCHAYPHAFISVVSSPELGTWIGASPEILVSSDKNKFFKTIALAGTQPKGNATDLQEVLWRQKEIEEQALVSRYIINCFKKIRVREFEEDGPKTVVAGNLLHLRTDFEVDTIAVNFPELATVMLKLLHPTSAVCGMPKPDSLQFIKTHEPHQRKLYAGFLGTVNIHEESHIFVNLRCMEIQKKQAILYAGAGITKDSVPEREWQETEIKCKTIAEAL
jgi:isochorismate synthase